MIDKSPYSKHIRNILITNILFKKIMPHSKGGIMEIFMKLSPKLAHVGKECVGCGKCTRSRNYCFRFISASQADEKRRDS